MPSLTVFLCSTFSDLSAEREGVLDAIRRLKLQHDSMEFFGARAGQPLETCLEEVRKSDALVVIVGHRYGTIVPDLGISFSEAEYSEGYRLQKPCLVYLRDEEVPVLPKHVERDPDRLRLLERWKGVLRERHTLATFRDGRDLSVQVAADLGRSIADLEEAARIKAEAPPADRGGLQDEIRALIEDALSQGVQTESLLSAVRRSISSLQAKKERRGPVVFLSYANLDREVVRQVASGLDAHGIRVWFDEAKLKPGVRWISEIERALDRADFILFFISASSVHRSWPQRELQIAMHRQISGEGGAVILPILLEEAEVPPLLRDIQWVDLRDRNVDRAIPQLVDVIRHWGERQGSRKRRPDGS